jgi:K+-transporting ATPase KdpF subunit
MRVSARTEEGLYPIFEQENAIFGRTPDRLPSLTWAKNYDGPDLRRNRSSFFCHQRSLRALLRLPLGDLMGTIIVGVIAPLLFVYLFIAMIRPEKF